MTSTRNLFEISWEVCNKVGGIHTVIASKAARMVERFEDRYIAIGPWLDSQDNPGFEEEAQEAGVVATCARHGLTVRAGRWQLPCRPRALLVDFSELFEHKDEILAGLWETYHIDSLFGRWDYIEPVLFGHACGLVVEALWRESLAEGGGEGIVQCHEWMTGSALLYLKQKVPGLATAFTTHATVLGRSLASTGRSPLAALGEAVPAQAAAELGVRAKHSIEAAAARESDVFTTVSELTQRECEVFLGRRPDVVTVNGMDLEYLADCYASVQPQDAREKLIRVGEATLGWGIDKDSLLVAISGRYEFRNKGIDLFLEALAELESRPGPPLVAFLLIPAGNTGLRSDVRARLFGDVESSRSERETCVTHQLADPQGDPIAQACARLGFDGAVGKRVTVLHVPEYIAPEDGLFECTYEALLRGFDVTCFPSFYEPWGYTPAESLAAGVPTISSDLAGIGRWALRAGLGLEDGIAVLPREGRDDGEAVSALAGVLTRLLKSAAQSEQLGRAGQRTVQRLNWHGLVREYDSAYELALTAARARGALSSTWPTTPEAPVGIRPFQQPPHLQRFEVRTTLPPALQPLEAFSENLWWTWNPCGEALLAEIDPELWEQVEHDPRRLFASVSPERLRKLAADSAYVARIGVVTDRLEQYLADTGAAHTGAGPTAERPVVYLSAEFGLHAPLRIYSGGLGVLAGDHLKSASDLGVPMVAIGLFYRGGYLRQSTNAEGDQVDLPVDIDPAQLALSPVRDARGLPLRVGVPLPNRTLWLAVYRLAVGRVSLYLLDSDVAENREGDRSITRRLYPADRELRLRQEIALGIGGARLVRELGITPSVYHLNEGHSAFVVLERASEMVRHNNLTFDEARVAVRADTVFTTHTPVPAGTDRFSESLMRKHFAALAQRVGVGWSRFMSFGAPAEGDSEFDMTQLALGFSSQINGVSELHAWVSRRMFHWRWPQLLEEEVPVSGLTNGVHLSTWTHPSIAAALGAGERPVRSEDYENHASAASATKLWSARLEAKQRLLHTIATRLERQTLERRSSPAQLERMLDGLRGEHLLVGFARRFASYKRADLILRDVDRLRRLVSDPERPMRLVFAGLAHPADGEGGGLLRRVVQLAHSPDFVGKVFFVDGYGLQFARDLVQGVDLWLNTPRRGLEASGTSGMKVAANGGLNLSIQDGWWMEAWREDLGWSIGERDGIAHESFQDELDAASLYRVLEDEVLPEFFDRDADGLPQRWLTRMRRALATLPVRFNSDRMVDEYHQRGYQPAAKRGAALRERHYDLVRHEARAGWEDRRRFEQVRFLETKASPLDHAAVGHEVQVHTTIDLAGLDTGRAIVEVVLRAESAHHERDPTYAVKLTPEASPQDNAVRFSGSLVLEHSGSHELGVRVRLQGRDPVPYECADLVKWADAVDCTVE
ncbi:MAG: alpha-glucan family phosphorylase [Myxococcales bacterium FL481]|nr:MAG: alpha-glucan family phosphorylase [Myxococcales bacterium FL481]